MVLQRPITSLLVILLFATVPVHCGIYKKMAEAMLYYLMKGGYDEGGKGVTLGIKNKGMTAIIPVPMPIPIFTKDKGGGGDYEKIKYVPVPVPSHGGKEDWW